MKREDRLKNMNEIYRMFRAYVLAIPFKEGVFHSYPLHTGNLVLLGNNLEKDHVQLNENNYVETETLLLEKIISLVEMREEKSRFGALMVHIGSPYRLQFLDLVYPFLEKDVYSEWLADCWSGMEFPHQHPVKRLVSMFKRANQEKLMDAEEKKIYDELAPRINVYRGTQSSKAKVRGLSWTFNLEKAKWFAERWKKLNGKVYVASITKKHVFAVFTGRGEDEIVLNPMQLREVEEVTEEHWRNWL